MAAGRDGGRAADQVTRQVLEEVWHETTARADLTGPDAAAIFVDLRRRYSEPRRTYHTLYHVAAMLDIVSGFSDLVHDDVAVRLAVWFHDAVYDSRRGDTEEQSAALAASSLGPAGAASLLPAVESLILATKTHQAPPGDTDCQLMLDADLAISGASADEYGRYARAIHEEYAWVPEADYRAGRRRVLEGFPDREHLYHTAPLFQEYEQAARANLRREVECLTDPQNP